MKKNKKILWSRLGGVLGAVVLGAAIMTSCSMSTGGVYAPRPSAHLSRAGNVKMDTLEYGYETFQNHCARCHIQRVPNIPAGRTWHPASMGMKLYGTLTDRQRFSVQQYLTAVGEARFAPNFGSLKNAH